MHVSWGESRVCAIVTIFHTPLRFRVRIRVRASIMIMIGIGIRIRISIRIRVGVRVRVRLRVRDGKACTGEAADAFRLASSIFLEG